jgi:hypothetical protein
VKRDKTLYDERRADRVMSNERRLIGRSRAVYYKLKISYIPTKLENLRRASMIAVHSYDSSQLSVLLDLRWRSVPIILTGGTDLGRLLMRHTKQSQLYMYVYKISKAITIIYINIQVSI